ncbi:hypothetical protein AMAG_16301 [Allomyces macrogynus ATCC 38327]|uniref:UvrD-like helicase ATP-binding domain-containing protein n=1 Tax=Allomyces macrogynus (strain ATCC 38327) TaxID=578462 RepID=A0A0L0TAU4_ALLM3|nr:hypothetical protein AMAG_16301 [Allomyces macrogynus ATCC 38327]|eukprot:KNE71872.1 hypothetical protein AMAG_16301 [Allomyces macrogynus ATCC 38327]
MIGLPPPEPAADDDGWAKAIFDLYGAALPPPEKPSAVLDPAAPAPGIRVASTSIITQPWTCSETNLIARLAHVSRLDDEIITTLTVGDFLDATDDEFYLLDRDGNKLVHLPDRFDSPAEYAKMLLPLFLEEFRQNVAESVHRHCRGVGPTAYHLGKSITRRTPPGIKRDHYTYWVSAEVMDQKADRELLIPGMIVVLGRYQQLDRVLGDDGNYVLAMIVDAPDADAWSATRVKDRVRIEFNARAGSVQRLVEAGDDVYLLVLTQITGLCRIHRALRVLAGWETMYCNSLLRAVLAPPTDMAAIEAELESFEIYEGLYGRHPLLTSLTLNSSQMHAISNVLLAEQQKVFVVEGPPGTGKTSTIMGMIVQLLAQGERCLVTGPTNMAATENAKRLIQFTRKARVSTPKDMLFRLGDMALVGNAARLGLDDDLRLIYVENRTKRLRELRAAIELAYAETQTLLNNFERVWDDHCDAVEVATGTDPDRDDINAMWECCTATLNGRVADWMKLCGAVLGLDDMVPTTLLAPTQIVDGVSVLQDVRTRLQDLAREAATVRSVSAQYVWSISASLDDRKPAHFYNPVEYQFLTAKRRVDQVLMRLHSNLRPILTLCSKSDRDMVDEIGKHTLIWFSTVSSSVRVNGPVQNAIVDEAAQLVEADTCLLLRIPKLQRIVLVGDDRQLPSVVLSDVAKRFKYDRSLFERLKNVHYPTVFLDTQYRMHPHISMFPRHQFYQGQLKDHIDFGRDRYHQSWHDLGDHLAPYQFIDVEGTEWRDNTTQSYSNAIEAEYIKKMLVSVAKALPTGTRVEVGVISPYSDQCKLIQAVLAKVPGTRVVETNARHNMLVIKNKLIVSINSIDGFQGQERDIIIFSCVRSNSKGKIGFLGEPRRLNVAITRARYSCWIIGHAKTLQAKNPVWQALLENAKAREIVLDVSTLPFYHEVKAATMVAKVEKMIESATGVAIARAKPPRVGARKQPVPAPKAVAVAGPSSSSPVASSSSSAFRAVASPPAPRAVVQQRVVAQQRPVAAAAVNTRGKSHVLDFAGAIWESSWSHQTVETMRRLATDDRAAVIRTMIHVLDGKFGARFAEKQTSRDLGDMLVTGGTTQYAFVWSIALRGHKDNVKQIIKFWWLGPRNGIAQGVHQARSALGSHSGEYIAACRKVKRSSESVNAYVPMTAPGGFEFMRTLRRSTCTETDHNENTSASQLELIKSYQINHALWEKFAAESVEALHAFDLLCDLTEQEKGLVRHEGSLFCLGRSGTGKTTVMLLKLWQREHVYRKRGSSDEPLTQLLLTLSPTLAANLQTQYEKYSKLLPEVDEEMAKKSVPRIASWRSVVDWLDSRLTEPFFQHERVFAAVVEDEDETPAATEESNDDDHNDDELQAEWDRDGEDANGQTVGLHRKDKTVDFGRFERAYYPLLPKPVRAFDPAFLWTQIQGVICGSLEALQSPDGVLTKDGYIGLAARRMSTLSESDRATIYDGYVWYARKKRARHEWDMADVVRHIYVHGSEVPRDIEYVYVDEAQDLSMAQIALLSLICANPAGFFFAGDTAQTITCSAFRFQDMKATFYTEFLTRIQEVTFRKATVPPLHTLTQNFRTHVGVLQLAARLVELLVKHFPQSIDQLAPEKAFNDGPLPFLFHGDEDTFIRQVFGGSSGCSLGASQAILVRDDDEKARVLQIMRRHDLDDGQVLTIFEAKGLEFNDVLLFNIVSTSPFKKWGLLAKDRHIDPMEHATLAHELKLLYVAVTRAKEGLWIYEERAEGNALLGMLVGEGLAIQSRADSSVPFSRESDPFMWEQQAAKLLDSNQYHLAYTCYKRAGNEAKMAYCAAFMAFEDAEKQEGARHGGPQKAAAMYAAAAAKFVDLDMFDKAAEAFMRSKRYREATEMFIKTNAWDDALEASWNTGNLDFVHETLATVTNKSATPAVLEKCARVAMIRSLKKNAPDSDVLRFAVFLDSATKRRLFNRYRKDLLLQLNVQENRFDLNATVFERMHKWTEAAQLWREAGNKVEAERCVRTVVMPHLLVLALNKPDAWPALAQEAVAELDKTGVSLGGGIDDALAALAEDPQDLESLGKKLARLSHWHGSKSPAIEAVLEILRFQALQRRVILLAHDSYFVDLTVELSQTLLQRTKSGMNALLQLLADLPLLDSRQGALPDLLAFSKDLSLPPGHVVISPVIVKAVHVVSGATKGDLVVVDAKTLRARMSEVLTAQLRGAVAEMNMLMTKLIQRMEYISLTLHKREDAHKDALERFYIQLAAFDLIQDLKSRTGDNSLQAPIGWFRTIFPANVFGLDYAELAQIRVSKGVQNAFRGLLTSSGSLSEGHVLRSLCLMGSFRGVIPAPPVQHLAQLHRGLMLIHFRYHHADPRAQLHLYFGCQALIEYFRHVYFMDEIADDVDPFDFLFHLEKTAALMLVLATRFNSLIISDRLLTLLEPIDPVAIGARLGSFDVDHRDQSWKPRTRYAEFDLRDTMVPLIGKILAKDHAVWRLVETKLTRIDRARFQTRLAAFLLLVHFNYGPRYQKMHSTIVEALVSDKRHGGIVIREDALRKEEYQDHLNELSVAGEKVIVCLNRESGMYDAAMQNRDLKALPRRVVVQCPNNSTWWVNLNGHGGSGATQSKPFEMRRLDIDQDEDAAMASADDISSLMRKEQQEHTDKLPPRIHAAVLAWVARVRRFRALRHEYVVRQGALPLDVQVEYEEHLVARADKRATGRRRMLPGSVPHAVWRYRVAVRDVRLAMLTSHAAAAALASSVQLDDANEDTLQSALEEVTLDTHELVSMCCKETAWALKLRMMRVAKKVETLDRVVADLRRKLGVHAA